MKSEHSEMVDRAGIAGVAAGHDPNPTGETPLSPTARVVRPTGYLTGTRIATARGDVPVESLKSGDLVLTTSSASRPVRRVRRWQPDRAASPEPQSVHPVRVAAGAFGRGLPLRDLSLSPGHGLAAEDGMIAAWAIVNGATITQVPLDDVTYWDVELDGADVILAEGLASASCLSAEGRDANPRITDQISAKEAGKEADALRVALFHRAKEMGFQASGAHDIHLVADGTRIDPITLGTRRFAFALPPACASVALNSRTFIPHDSDPPSQDGRVLGVPVKRLQIDGEDVNLRALPSADWHSLEKRATHVQRWTKGLTPIRPNARLVLVDLAGEGRYWLPPSGGTLTLVR